MNQVLRAMKGPGLRRATGALLLSLSSAGAHAGVGTSLMQTADVLRPGQYELKIQNDIIFNRGGGFNISPHFSTGLIDRLVDVDAYLGTGYTDFQIGAMGKYNFLPDLDGQVGLSFNAGMEFIYDKAGTASESSVNITTGILASKTFNAEFGRFVPYTSLQVEFHINGSNSSVPITILAGSRWDPAATAPWRFFSEFSFGVKDSFYGLALGVSYPF